jgi:extracellular factor (EF) 3-hydroxypalmitic acid methyl ester biosynthesis protein
MAIDLIRNSKAETLISCQNSHGVDIHATLLQLNRFSVSFEFYSPVGVLRLSEVLNNFKIISQGVPIYTGRAVLTNLIHVGAVGVCEATLDEACLDLSLIATFEPPNLHAGFDRFMEDWAKTYRVGSEFKVVMADLQTLFTDLRLWIEHLEMGVRSQPVSDHARMEMEILRTLEKPILPLAFPLLEKFELLASRVEPELQAAHRAYMKRQIHPLVLCSPFLYRTFQKPLGYAGDYEMVNMMIREPFEGSSMFAKMVNRIFLNTPPVLAHQSRIVYLVQHLISEAMRTSPVGELRVYNLGCGPAREIQRFIAESDFSNRARFTLLDFNEETLNHTSRVLSEVKQRHSRNTSVDLLRRSVQQVLKDAGKPAGASVYDLVYCAGLFDYLTDAVCKRLTNYLYSLVAPGGLLLCTNVSDSNPSRNWMEYVLDWHLIYRNSTQMASFIPDKVSPEAARVIAIGDGVNIGLEVRKPTNGI